MKVLYVCPLAHLTGHPPFESTKETRILQEKGVDVELLTFCGVHEGFEVAVPQVRVMSDNFLFKKLRRKFVTQWILRVFEYGLTILKAVAVAKDRSIYLRDAEPFPHFVHIVNLFARKKWVISSTGGLYTTGTGVSIWYKQLLKLTSVTWPGWYKLSRGYIKYSVQGPEIKTLMYPLLGSNITIVPLGHRIESVTDRKIAQRELGLSDDKLVVLIFGANHSGKDTEVVFKALTDLKDTTLIHAGPSVQSAGKKPEELVQKYYSNALVFNRQIGNIEKKLFFGASDWVILSYNTSFSSTTSMLWEACSFGIPVIASSGTQLELLVKYWNVGIVFQAGDVESLKYHLHLARSKSLRDSYKINCRTFTEFYSEEKWCQQTLKLLKS